MALDRLELTCEDRNGRCARRRLAARYHATVNANRYAYIYTGQVLEGDGFDLVRFDKTDGSEKGRIRLKDRMPTYVIEPESGTVVAVVGRELVGYRYPAP